MKSIVAILILSISFNTMSAEKCAEAGQACGMEGSDVTGCFVSNTTGNPDLAGVDCICNFSLQSVDGVCEEKDGRAIMEDKRDLINHLLDF